MTNMSICSACGHQKMASYLSANSFPQVVTKMDTSLPILMSAGPMSADRLCRRCNRRVQSSIFQGRNRVNIPCPCQNSNRVSENHLCCSDHVFVPCEPCRAKCHVNCAVSTECGRVIRVLPTMPTATDLPSAPCKPCQL